MPGKIPLGTSLNVQYLMCKLFMPVIPLLEASPEPRQDKTNKVALAPSENFDQPGRRMPGLI